MVTVTEKELKEHLNNLINAIYAFSPTRNYVLQLLELLPKDYVTMAEAYPELFKDEKSRQMLKDILGIKIGEKVELGYGLGYILDTISYFIKNNVFGRYNWKDLQPKLTKFLNRELPDVRAELFEHKIKIAIAEPTYGEDIKKVLTIMTREGKGEDLCVGLSEMMEKIGIDRNRLLVIKKFLTTELEILESGEEVLRLRSEFKEFKDVLSKFFGMAKE